MIVSQQEMMDIVNAHPEMEVVKEYYNLDDFPDDFPIPEEPWEWVVKKKGSGEVIGDVRFGWRVAILEQLQPAIEGSDIINIGFSERQQRWYGWKLTDDGYKIDRFGIGDEVQLGDVAFNPNRHGWTAKTLDDAKEMAIDFVAGV